MDDGSGRATSAYNVEDTTGRAVPTMGALEGPFFACSPMDAAIGCASPIDAVAVPMPVTLTTGVGAEEHLFRSKPQESPTSSDAARDMAVSSWQKFVWSKG